jgi:hypothetical protein
MVIKKECIKQLTDTRIKCEENKRKIIFLNSSRIKVKKIRVDGCQIIDGVKCDFLVTYNKTENFIELKGEDIKHALAQLIRTISILGSKNCQNRNSFIISSRSPLTSAEIQNHRLLFKRKHSSTLIVKNRNLEVEI